MDEFIIPDRWDRSDFLHEFLHETNKGTCAVSAIYNGLLACTFVLCSPFPLAWGFLLSRLGRNPPSPTDLDPPKQP